MYCSILPEGHVGFDLLPISTTNQKIEIHRRWTSLCELCASSGAGGEQFYSLKRHQNVE
jgi:hypothetical protein